MLVGGWHSLASQNTCSEQSCCMRVCHADENRSGGKGGEAWKRAGATAAARDRSSKGDPLSTGRLHPLVEGPRRRRLVSCDSRWHVCGSHAGSVASRTSLSTERPGGGGERDVVARGGVWLCPQVRPTAARWELPARAATGVKTCKAKRLRG